MACLFPGLAQGMALGVRPARPLMPTATDDGALSDDDAAHIGIRVSAVNPLPGQTNSLGHVLPVVQLTLVIVTIRQQRHLAFIVIIHPDQ